MIYAVALLVTLCNALSLPDLEGSLMNTPAPVINISFPASNDISIQCNGRQFGSNLHYGSCLDAFATFGSGGSSDPLVIARRRGGINQRSLPWKWVSGDGRCTFDVVMKGGASLETTTGSEIARSAWKLLNECVRDQGGQGGVVSNIGESHTLGIIIRSYEPTAIECGTVSRQFSHDKCAKLLSQIPADISPKKTWGPRTQPGIDFDLPHEWKVISERCRIMVWGAYGHHNVMDSMSLYEMWTAGVMLAGMCARYGKTGKYEHLGANGRLWVLLDDDPPRPNALSGDFAPGNQSISSAVASKQETSDQ